MLPSVRPFKAGAACLVGALTLGLAAGSLGLGPGDAPARRLPRPRLPRAPRRRRRRAPVLGHPHPLPGDRRPPPVRLPADRRRAAAHRRLDRRRGPGDAPGRRHRPPPRLRRSTHEFAAVLAGEPTVHAQSPRSPSPARASRGRARRPCHARRGAGAGRLGALSRPVRRARTEPSPRTEEEPTEEIEPRRAPERPEDPSEEELTPMGNRRSAVTEADDFDWLAAQAGRAEALERQAEGEHRARPSGSVASSSRRSATSASRRGWSGP